MIKFKVQMDKVYSMINKKIKKVYILDSRVYLDKKIKN